MEKRAGKSQGQKQGDKDSLYLGGGHENSRGQGGVPRMGQCHKGYPPGTGGWTADSSSTLWIKSSSPGLRSLLLFLSGESVLLRKTFPLANRALTAPLGSGCWGPRRGEGPCIFCQGQLLPSRARSRKNYRIFTSARLLVSPSPTPPW